MPPSPHTPPPPPHPTPNVPPSPHTLPLSCRFQVYPKHLAWFANYLVVRRAAQEVNYHPLYVQLVDKMGNKDLFKLLIKTSHYYVKILLYR